METRYLILAGAPKCESTTLYEALAAHPEIAVTQVKEPMFFSARDHLDQYFPKAYVQARREQDFTAYRSFFQPPDRPVRLDASVGYLEESGIPERIAAHLPSARILFLLRDPVERFLSFSRYQKQLALIQHDVSLEAYVRDNLTAAGKGAPMLPALSVGRYHERLSEWYASFPPEQTRRLSAAH
ncbi:MAG: sulfotransferase domain-containing protein [Opitutales bacterium]